MIKLPVSRLKNGMTTAQSIYNRQGASYLTRGTKLNKQYIDRLRKIGVPDVTVTSVDPNIALLPPEDIIKEETRVNAIHQVFDTYSRLQEEETTEVSPLLTVSESIITDLIDKPENLVQMTDIRLYDDYTFAHSVNVAALSAMLGILCHFPKKDILTITTGGLLHDIGKLDVAKQILNKPSALNQDEFDSIRQHPLCGYNRLMQIQDHRFNAKVIADIAFQHHEHLDGNGYPQHLHGEDISDFSRIVAIADVYDALTTQRPYKKAYAPHIAYKIMTRCSGKQFDPALLSLFFNHVALYPTGTVLKTAMGYGIVKSIKIGMTKYPRLILFADGNHRLFATPMIVEVAEQEPDFILSALDGSELTALCFQLRFDPSQLLMEDE